MAIKRLHLTERLHLDHPAEEKGFAVSGYWPFYEEKALSFIGCFLFLHERQSAPARYAGEIVGVVEQTEGKYGGRFIFLVKDEPRLIGITTSTDGWNRWMKTE